MDLGILSSLVTKLAKSEDRAYLRNVLEKNLHLVNSKDQRGNSLLHICARGGFFSAAEILLENGADVNILSKDEISPLQYACRESHEELAKLLIRNNANLNYVASRSGFSPLHYACHAGNVSIASFLIRSGADITARDTKGNIALFYVQDKNRKHELRKVIEEIFAERRIKEASSLKLVGARDAHVNAINGIYDPSNIHVCYWPAYRKRLTSALHDSGKKNSNSKEKVVVSNAYGVREGDVKVPTTGKKMDRGTEPSPDASPSRASLAAMDTSITPPTPTPHTLNGRNREIGVASSQLHPQNGGSATVRVAAGDPTVLDSTTHDNIWLIFDDCAGVWMVVSPLDPTNVTSHHQRSVPESEGGPISSSGGWGGLGGPGGSGGGGGGGGGTIMGFSFSSNAFALRGGKGSAKGASAKPKPSVTCFAKFPCPKPMRPDLCPAARDGWSVYAGHLLNLWPIFEPDNRVKLVALEPNPAAFSPTQYHLYSQYSRLSLSKSNSHSASSSASPSSPSMSPPMSPSMSPPRTPPRSPPSSPPRQVRGRGEGTADRADDDGRRESTDRAGVGDRERVKDRADDEGASTWRDGKYGKGVEDSAGKGLGSGGVPGGESQGVIPTALPSPIRSDSAFASPPSSWTSPHMSTPKPSTRPTPSSLVTPPRPSKAPLHRGTPRHSSSPAPRHRLSSASPLRPKLFPSSPSSPISPTRLGIGLGLDRDREAVGSFDHGGALDPSPSPTSSQDIALQLTRMQAVQEYSAIQQSLERQRALEEALVQWDDGDSQGGPAGEGAGASLDQHVKAMSPVPQGRRELTCAFGEVAAHVTGRSSRGSSRGRGTVSGMGMGTGGTGMGSGSGSGDTAEPDYKIDVTLSPTSSHCIHKHALHERRTRGASQSLGHPHGHAVRMFPDLGTECADSGGGMAASNHSLHTLDEARTSDHTTPPPLPPPRPLPSDSTRSNRSDGGGSEKGSHIDTEGSAMVSQGGGKGEAEGEGGHIPQTGRTRAATTTATSTPKVTVSQRGGTRSNPGSGTGAPPAPPRAVVESALARAAHGLEELERREQQAEEQRAQRMRRSVSSQNSSELAWLRAMFLS